MAFNKRGKRKLVVNGSTFFWIYKFEPEILSLTIMSEEKTHSRLICIFDYKNFWLYFKERIENKDFESPTWKLTPDIARKVILFSIENGWKPFEKGKDFVLDERATKYDFNFLRSPNSDKSQTTSEKSKI